MHICSHKRTDTYACTHTHTRARVPSSWQLFRSVRPSERCLSSYLRNTPSSGWRLRLFSMESVRTGHQCQRWRKRSNFSFTYWEWERARAGIEPAAAVPSQPDWPVVSRSENSAGSAAVGSTPALALSHSQKVISGNTVLVRYTIDDFVKDIDGLRSCSFAGTFDV